MSLFIAINEYFHVFGPIIGVIAGFMLAVIRDIFEYRQKIKVELKDGSFNYFVQGQDAEGFLFRKICGPGNANGYQLNLVVDIYNYGKSNTAIKDISIKVVAFKNYKQYLTPDLYIDDMQNNSRSFNLPSNNIKTATLNMTIKKDEENELFFDEAITLSPEDKGRLYFVVIFNNIKGSKENKLLIEPISILTAENND